MRWIVYLFVFTCPSFLLAQTQAPNPQLIDGKIQWSLVDAVSINVHSGDGAWIESLPGDSTVWAPASQGSYFFVATDTGEWSQWGRSSTVVVDSVDGDGGDNDAAGPENLRAEVYSDSAIELFWDQPSSGNATGYIIKRDGVIVNTTDGRSYHESGLSSGTSYTYSVNALYASGAQSADGAFVVTTTGGQPDTDPPITPNNGVTYSVYSSTAAELFWQREGSNAVEIYRNNEFITSINASSYFDGSLVSGTQYQYDVRYAGGSVIGSVEFTTLGGSGGNNPEPEELVNKLPSKVVDLRVSVYSDEALELFWGLASDEDGSVEGYDVYRNDQPVAQVEGGSYFDTGLNASTSYSYEIRARDDTGATGQSAMILAVTNDSPDPLPEPVAIELPEDCISARDSDGSVFCFSPTDRTLLSTFPDGTLYWSFPLPGASGANDIRALVLTGDALVIVAELNAAEGTSGYELSAFDKTGEYRYTAQILSGLDSAKVVSDAIKPLRVLVDDGDLIVIGEYALEGGSGDPIGAFVARTNTDTGDTTALRRFAGRVLGGAPTIAEGALLLTLDGALTLYNVQTLEPLFAGSGLTFNTTNYQESKELALSIMKSADFAAIDGRIANAIDVVVPDDLVAPTYPEVTSQEYEFNCSDGGAIRVLFTSSSYRNNSTSYNFASCVNGDEVIDGEYEVAKVYSYGKYGGDTTDVQSYNRIRITQPGIALWRVDGSKKKRSYNYSYVYSSSYGSSNDVQFAEYYEDRLGETVSIVGSYSSGAGTSTSYNYSTGGRTSSPTDYNNLTGTASRSSKASDTLLEVSISPRLYYQKDALSPTSGKLEIKSSDGSSLIVETNNGSADSVQYRISDGEKTTILEAVW